MSVNRTVKIVVANHAHNDLLAHANLPKGTHGQADDRTLSNLAIGKRSQFSVRTINEDENTIIIVDQDQLRAKPKRVRRFVETNWKGDAVKLQAADLTWQFDLSNSRVGLFLVAGFCGVAPF